MPKKLTVVLIGLGLFLMEPPGAFALTCDGSISPTVVSVGSTTNIVNQITNNGPETIDTVRVESRDANAFQINGGSASGWNVAFDNSSITYSGGTLASGQSVGFTFIIEALQESGPVSMDGTVMFGGESVGCGGGDLQTGEVQGPPVIAGLAVSVGSTSASVSWTTDVEATSTVNYGLTNGYGLSKSGSAAGTSHAFTLDALTPSTAYYYKVLSTNSNGTRESGGNSFTTGAAGVTTTTTTTVTNTVTETVNEIVTKTVILADTVKPVVKIETRLDKPVAVAPIVEGVVVDSGSVNVGIVKIQYSTDNGTSWLLVDEPSGATKVDFSFVPEVYEDGNYQILVRATDKSGNTGESQAQTLVIDRLPPGIIHSLWRVGPLILTAPYQVVVGVPVQITVQAVGGVTQMDMIVGEEKLALVKNFETGLWEGEIELEHDGKKQVIVKAVDGGGNEIEQEVGGIVVMANDQQLAARDTKMTIYKYDDVIKRFKMWNGEVYGQANPSTGKASWYLPPGKYYVAATTPGYRSAETQIFILEVPGVVGVAGELQKWTMWGWWQRARLSIKQEINTINEGAKILDNTQIGWLEKTEWRGREIDLTVVPIWEPRMAGLLRNLGEEAVVVIPGANTSSVDLLKIRGQYKMELVADPDGEILTDLQGVSLPVNLKINRRGQVDEVK